MKILSRILIAATGLVYLPIVSGKILILTEHLAPFQIVKDNQVTGYATDVVRDTFKGAGLDYQIKVDTWTMAYYSALRNPNACLYSIVKTHKRAPLFNWVGEIHKVSPAFYSFKKDRVNLNSLQDAKQYKTVIVKNDVAHDFLIENGFESNLHYYAADDTNAQWKVLKSSKRDMDLIITNDLAIGYRQQLNQDDLAVEKVMDLKQLDQSFQLACNISMDKKIVVKLKQSFQQVDKNAILKQYITID
ncbi:substrate-binding periplasmic protein [Paraglaciecola aestuariivivens]